MKSQIKGLVVLVALNVLLVGCATKEVRSVRGPDYADREAQAEIGRRLQQVFDAAETKDFQRLDGYHLYGPKFTKFSGGSNERLDADATRQGEHDGLGAINGLKMRAENLKIDVFEKVAVATFILDYSFDLGGQTAHRKDRTTLVFVNDRGNWQIAHEHLSPLNP